MQQVTAAYEGLTKSLDFKQHQDLLFEHIDVPAEQAKVVAGVKEATAVATAAAAATAVADIFAAMATHTKQDSSNNAKRAGVRARVRNAGAPADSTQASSSRAAAPASATRASSSRKRKQATNRVRDIEVIQLDDDESPVSKRQPLPEPQQPATKRLSAPSTSMQAQESLSVHNPHAASTSQASGFSHKPSPTAMPAQRASTSSAVLHDQPLPQRQQVQLSEQQNPNLRTPSPFADLNLADFNDLLTAEEMRWVEQPQIDLQPFGQQNPNARTPSPFADLNLADFNDLLTAEEMRWVEQPQRDLQPFGQQNPFRRTPSPHF